MSTINIELTMKPKSIKPSSRGYVVSIFLEDELLTVMDEWYNDYTEAEVAAKKYIMEKLK